MEFIRILAGLSLVTKILITVGAFVCVYLLHRSTSLTASTPRAALIGIIFGTVVGLTWGLSNYDSNDSLLTALPLMTQVFIVLILMIWGYFFFFRFTPTTVSNVPSVLTSLGIFGTFVGIAWGLSGFDANDIEGSIPTLLDGLKTAFWSSIAGLGGAVSIKLRHVVATSFGGEVGKADKGTTIDEVASLLGDLNRSLAGDEEPTVLSQLLLSRQDSNERLDNLKRSLDELAKQMDKTNSQTLIESSQEILQDFNTNINEPLDENSEQPNQVVEKI